MKIRRKNKTQGHVQVAIVQYHHRKSKKDQSLKVKMKVAWRNSRFQLNLKTPCWMICKNKAKLRMILSNKKRKIKRKNHKRKRKEQTHQAILIDFYLLNLIQNVILKVQK